MKGICLIRSRGWHFSPSLPGDRYLKLGSKSDLRAEISGSIVGYGALAPRPEVLRSISCFYGNRPIRLIQCCTHFRFLGVKVLCVFHLHDNIAFTFKWYGNTWNKTFYSQRIWIGYNIELAELVYSGYFVYATGSIQELVLVIGVIGRVISHFKIILRAWLPPNCKTRSPISNYLCQ